MPPHVLRSPEPGPAVSPRAASFVAGVIEGFYGRPWNARQRHQLFTWMRAGDLNTYLYAPKDEPHHRLRWRVPYPESAAAEVAALIHDCHRHGLQFVYALAPGLDWRPGDPTEVALLRERAAQLQTLGCRHFALAFDDLPTPWPLEDQAAWAAAAGTQAAVANQLRDAIGAAQPDGNFFFCPTVYCGRMAHPSVSGSAYLATLGQRLHPEIEVFWTGPDIISETLTLESLDEVAAVLRRKPLIWDNLHANDYDMRRLYLGPYTGRPAELRAHVRGLLLNPNVQFEANFVPVRTLGAYLRSPTPATPETARDEALTAWLPLFRSLGPNPPSLEDLRLLSDLFHLPFALGPQAQQYVNDLRRLRDAAPPLPGEVLTRFQATNQRVLDLFDRLTALADRELVHALYAHLWEAKETALLLRSWAGWRTTHPSPHDRFCSSEYRPGLYRGGLAATLERLLPLDANGCFGPPVPEGPGPQSAPQR